MPRTKKTYNPVTNAIIWKVALYIRLSVEDGNENESTSVQNQKVLLDDYLSNWDEHYILVDRYIDDGVSGATSDRENFQRMLEDITEERINCVIVVDLSRLGRNYIEAGIYMEQFFVKHNVRFISTCSPALDSYKNPEQMNSISVPLQNLVNEEYVRQCSIKIRNVQNVKRKKGEFIGSYAPYGFKKSPENKYQLVIDEEPANVLRDMYRWCVNEGLGSNGIVRRLNDLGIPNPTKYKQLSGSTYACKWGENNDGLWSAKTVRELMRSQMNLGHMVQGKTTTKSYKVHDVVRKPEEDWVIVRNTHEAIIDQETFDKAQALLTKDTRISPKSGELSLFAGFIRCADCGKAMGKKSSKGVKYYSCRTYKEKSSKACTSHTIKEDTLKQAVLAVIKQQIDIVDNLNMMIDEINNLPDVSKKSDRLEQNLRSKELELTKVTRVIDSLYIDWKTGEIDREMYYRLKEKQEAKASDLKLAMNKLNTEISLLAKGVTTENIYFREFLQYKNINELDRNILVSLIDTIKVHEDKHITIKFNYADEYLRIMEFIENNISKKPKVMKSKEHGEVTGINATL